MLSERERAALAQIERRLQYQDPEFVRRCGGGARPSRHPWSGQLLTVVMCVLAMVAALAALVGSTGVAAGLALMCGAVGLTKYFEEE